MFLYCPVVNTDRNVSDFVLSSTNILPEQEGE